MKRALNVSCLLCYQASPTPVCQWCEDDIFSFDTRKYKENLLSFGLISRHVRHCRYQRLCVYGLYTPPLSSLIHLMKFRHSLTASQEIGRLFVDKWQQHTGPKPDLLLPVPLGARRFAQRQFNQSAVLALYIGRKLGIPVYQHWAIRQTDTAQHLLDKQARYVNAKHSYALTKHGIDGYVSEPSAVLRVAIVDDVITTGITVDRLAGLLSARYPHLNIEIWAVAFTPPPKSHLLNAENGIGK
ncbi:MAG TPA: ComF family protein [Alteromonas australica]|uniref:ComF family protein n=3 Tax=Alteromonas australica TaxID=589873 RepID=A0A349TSZ0_9ALTE|nr:hypothetical protein [Alteromonas sp.]HAU27155.1 ComF family protein [Alteromonas australica]HAW76934.1 ComF family protein [Alteromonas australica]